MQTLTLEKKSRIFSAINGVQDSSHNKSDGANHDVENGENLDSNNPPIGGKEKLLLVFILAFMSCVAPLATDMYLPALPIVAKSLNVGDFEVQLSLASFFIAFALGQLIYGPLSDTYGRKKPLIAGLLIFSIASISCAFVDSAWALIILRFFQALGGCAGVVIARAIVNDRFNIREAVGIFAMMMVVVSIAPMLAPSIGSILLGFFDWHSIFITLFILGILILLFVTFFFKESVKEEQEFSNKLIIDHYLHILKDKLFVTYVISAALSMSAIFAYITGSSFVFIEVFGVSKTTFSTIFGMNALGMMIFSVINSRLVLKFAPLQVLKWAFVFMVCCSIGLIIAGIASHVETFELALFFTIASLGLILPNLTAISMARFKAYSGAASATLGVMQYGIAGIISFIIGAIGANTPVMLGISMAVITILGAGLYFSTKFIKKDFEI